ncbi:MAG: thiamine phosphate synthase [Nitrospirae bacterium]|nr:thiamine phosphate synthase [Nitrospirota bacterium]
MKMPFYEGIEAALRGGVKAIQLREKDLTVRDLHSTACRLRDLTARYGARLFVNDRVDVALSVGADGVHLGGRSIPLRAVRKIAEEKLLIGVSTHSIEEAVEAERYGADFITFGPVYETPSKRAYGPPVGVERLEAAAAKVSIPVFALGGVRLERIPELLKAGAAGVALISAILSSYDVEGEAARFVRALDRTSRAPSC